jgi:capsular polysaccharide biosynthesis protein
LVVGCALALVGAVALVFAAECLDSSYRTPDEVAMSLQLPVFATIPLLTSGNEWHDVGDTSQYLGTQ